jgi:ABC transport system ATP-binding/permease protein
LSGGERNRLLLARLFTRPANVMVLDEPTNDLDLETLELLEAQLTEWAGTLMLVSHDRAFLDNVVTSTLVFEGHGRITEYVGGYEDWLRQRPAPSADVAPDESESAPSAETEPVGAQGKRRLSYNEQRELASLPETISALELEQSTLQARVHSAQFYKEPPDAISAVLARAEQVDRDLLAAYARWDELDSRA